MKLFIFAFLLLSSTSLFACGEIPSKFLPVQKSMTIILCRTQYEVEYDPSIKSPRWSGYTFNPSEALDKEERKNMFAVDPTLSDDQKAKLNDYAKSGYERGHLFPANDTSTFPSMRESFYLSNMIPQNPNNNKGIWKKLEAQTKQEVMKGKTLIIFSGPIYGSNPQTIGENKIPIPDKLFKIVIDPSTLKTKSWIIPNIKVNSRLLNKFTSSVGEIEKQTGYKFGGNLHLVEK